MSKKYKKDAIYGCFTKPAIKRLIHKVGIENISGVIYEEVRGIGLIFMENFLRSIITRTEYYRRKTVYLSDVYSSMEPVLFLPEKNPIKKCDEHFSGKVELCFDLLIAPFQSWVRHVAMDFKTDLRFNEHALVAIQLYLEYYLLGVFSKAKFVMLNAKRKTLYPRDLQVVVKKMFE